MDTRPVLHIAGLLLCALAAGMILPMLVDLAEGHPDWKVFFRAFLVTGFFGGLLVFTTSGGHMEISPRQGFLMITLCWAILCLFAALPFRFSALDMSMTDALFEAVSGLTTTGATVMTGLDDAPKGILLWRALLQWLGGIGVILMAFSILPFLKIGGMQLFRAELSENEKAVPRTAQFAAVIGILYIVLTACNVIAYRLAGLSLFDAFAHAMTTIATGGFSTYDASFGAYAQSPWPRIVGILFMIAGSLPFILYMRALGGEPGKFLSDSQVRWFFGILLSAIAIMSLYLIFHTGVSPKKAFLDAAFNTTSLMTGTGYTSGDFGVWGAFAPAFFFLLMVVGACAGSTSCGIKVFRFQILHAVTEAQIRRLIFPHGVFVPHYAGKPLPEETATSVMSFFFLFGMCFGLLAVGLSLTGVDFITALSGAASAIANVGPGMGPVIGPVGTYQPLSDVAKHLLCLGMLLGRLELFPVLVLLSPKFWQQ